MASFLVSSRCETFVKENRWFSGGLSYEQFAVSRFSAGVIAATAYCSSCRVLFFLVRGPTLVRLMLSRGRGCTFRVERCWQAEVSH